VLITLLAFGVMGFAALWACWQQRQASRRALVARVEELTALSEAVSAIASAQLDENALCDLVFERAGKLVDTSSFHLGVYEGSWYHTRVRSLHGQRLPNLSFRLDDGPSIVAWMRKTGQPLLIRDFEKEKDTLPARPRAVSAFPPKAILYVPMIAGERMIGAISIASQTVGAYTDSHLRVLGIIANQAGAAILNARALQRERHHAEQLELVDAVATQTAAILDIDALLPRVVNAIRDAFRMYAVGLYMLDEATGAIVCRASTVPKEVDLRLGSQVGLRATCIREQRLIVAQDITHDDRFLFAPNMPATKSEAAIPLWIDNAVVGCLDLQSDRPNAFPADDARYLEVLAQQVAVAVDSARLYRDSLASQKMEQELAFARDIQTSFLPRNTPQVAGWSVGAMWESARQVSGDFYDFIRLPQNRWGLVMADVADKGVPAALFMAVVRTLMRSAAMGGMPPGRPPAQALARANRFLMQDTRTDMFVTVFYAIWHPDTGLVEYACGGHNPPLFCHAGRAQELRADGIALGAIDEISPEQKSLLALPGDALMLYTDGLIDALNNDGDEFGLARLRQTFEKLCHLRADEIVAGIMAAVHAHTGDAEPFDDQTLVVVKRDAAPSA
jgi:serine phosphatase RsbU (regulator of sigma subunit)/putative methionine-R-sulfoxide reductase with GAF domain